MSNILISLAAEFVGKKAFSDADKATTSLEKNVKKLGKTLGISLSTAAIVAYGRASVKAFSDDEAAAQRLTTAVNNLGLSFANLQVASFISDLEKSASVADDTLRPAFQALLTTTGSLTQSQKLLNLAIETSRGTGIELTTVAKDIGMAYVGNTRGLRKYNLGLTQAELKTASFADVQARLNQQFTGANAAYLDTTAGKLTAISLASDRLSESVGGALVDAFVAISGSNGIGDLVNKIDLLATKITRFGDGLEVFAYKVKVAFSFEGLIKGQEFIDKKVAEFERRRQYEGVAGFTPGNNAVTGYSKDEAARKKAEADAAKRAKELAKLAAGQVKAQKALTAEQKKQAMAKKQSSLFDLEQIQLIAALQGKLSKEEQDRVKLQLALLTGNTTEADKLSQKIAMSIDRTGELAAFLKTLPDAKNPFEAWNDYLDGIIKKVAAATGSKIPTDTGVITPKTMIPSTNASPVATGANRVISSQELAAYIGSGRSTNDLYNSQPVIKVVIDGKEIASAVQNQSLSGNDPLVNRLLGGFR
jgi:hypothetical protein